jgi:hypothetical protein
MSTVGWVIIAVSAWVVLAGLVGLVLGGVIARRDRQVPRPPQVDAPDRLPRRRLRRPASAYRWGRHK